MTRVCVGCGASLEGRHPNARWCSKAGCRKRVQRGGSRFEPAAGVVAGSTGGSTASALLRDLEAAGLVESPLGSAALKLAQLVDAADGPGAAGLVRELRATLVDVAALAPVKADPLDELGARRASRRAG